MAAAAEDRGEKVSCVANAHKFTFTWTIHNFAQRCKNEFESDVFYAGFKNITYWKFIVYPTKISNEVDIKIPVENKKYISVFLKMVSGNSFGGELKFSYVDAKNRVVTVTWHPISRSKFECGEKYGHEKFLCYCDVFDPKKNVLSESGSLTIQCTLFYMKGETTSYAEHMNKRLKLCFDMEGLIGNEKFSDIDIIAKGCTFAAHKVILCSRSEYFMNMFKHDTLEKRTNRVELDLDIEATQQFLRYLYTGSINPPSLDVAEALFIAADKYLLDDLKSICCEYFVQILSKETTFKLLSLADKYNQDNLKTRALNLIATDVRTMIQSAEWLEFATKHPHLMADIIVHVLDYRNRYGQDYCPNSPSHSP